MLKEREQQMTIKTMSMKDLRDRYVNATANAKKAKSSLKIIQDEIERRLKPLANDYGTFNREVDAIGIKIVKAKNIAWDGEKLKELYNQIEADNADPSVYIKRKVEYTVAENSYKEWSDDLKNIFDVARTEKEPKFSFEFADGE